MLGGMGGVDERVVAADDLGQARVVAREHGRAAGHRFEQRQPESLVERREREDLAERVERCELFVGDGAGDDDLRAHRGRAGVGAHGTPPGRRPASARAGAPRGRRRRRSAYACSIPSMFFRKSLVAGEEDERLHDAVTVEDGARLRRLRRARIEDRVGGERDRRRCARSRRRGTGVRRAGSPRSRRSADRNAGGVRAASGTRYGSPGPRSKYSAGNSSGNEVVDGRGEQAPRLHRRRQKRHAVLPPALERTRCPGDVRREHLDAAERRGLRTVFELQLAQALASAPGDGSGRAVLAGRDVRSGAADPRTRAASAAFAASHTS